MFLIKKLTPLWFFLFGFFLPTQLGKHFWPLFSYLRGARSDYLSPTLYLTDILLIGFFLLYFPTLLILGKKISIFFRKNPYLFLFFGIFLATNFFVAQYKMLFLYRVWQYDKIFLTAYIFASADKKHLKLFLRGVALSLVYVLLLGVWQVKTGGSVQGAWWALGERAFTINTPGISTVSLNGAKYLRAYSTFSHPNSLAGFGLGLFFLFSATSFSLGTLLAFMTIFISFAKFPLFILIGLFFLQQFFKQKQCTVCLISRLIIFSICLLLIWQFKGNPASLAERFIQMQFGLEYLLKHPLGAGLGHSLSVLSFSQPIHNIYLLFLVETGWVGILILVMGLASLIRKIKVNPTVFYLIAPILLAGFFDHYTITLPQNILLLGILLGIGNQSAKKRFP